MQLHPHPAKALPNHNNKTTQETPHENYCDCLKSFAMNTLQYLILLFPKYYFFPGKCNSSSSALLADKALAVLEDW